jgi:BirA family biotin operon repressor/biotin-[acetyl-CoA-carboxylase] ligase
MDQEQEELFSSDSIIYDLGTRIIGRRVLYFPRLTSTMDAARQEALGGTAEGTVVIAGEQTAGRGRVKRSWFAPAGNIALSVILFPRLADLPSLIMLASLAVVHSLRTITGIEAQIKWPNDVLIHGRKVCGILIETDVRKERVEYAVIGIGVNVDLTPNDFPEIEATTTSLSRETGKQISHLSLVRGLLIALDRLYLSLKAGDSLYEEWRDNLVTLGRHVRVRSGDSISEGIAESVDRDGSLLLRSPDGKLTRIDAGDVTLRD